MQVQRHLRQVGEHIRMLALGLVAMEERAVALGGRLVIRSAPGAGTTVRLQCPLAAW